ncbi:hypothetical protein COO60DRAFT_1497603 [Scenedesmus sp. NREL 46B-D3]|nr:hypothetical protein COO60DRAFT_1497603 [Scenedesmus sp. NREL 46B-D3]
MAAAVVCWLLLLRLQLCHCEKKSMCGLFGAVWGMQAPCLLPINFLICIQAAMPDCLNCWAGLGCKPVSERGSFVVWQPSMSGLGAVCACRLIGHTPAVYHSVQRL